MDITLAKNCQKTSKTEEKPSFFANSARLCSVFFAIAYPLWIHCGVDKASILDLFSGIAINILFSIAPLFWEVLAKFWDLFWPNLIGLAKFWDLFWPNWMVWLNLWRNRHGLWIDQSFDQ